MENHQNKLSLEKVENVTNQKDVTHKSNVRSVNFSELMEIPLEKNLSNRMSSIEILKNFIKESENTNNISTIKTAKTSNNKNKLLRNSEKNLSAEQEQSVGESLQSADASELSFLTNDFLSGDCNCIEQASQLVDPTLIDSESTPISFNNNDTVQLYKFNLTNSHEDNLMSLNKNCNDLMVSRKNITEKYGELLGKSDKVVEKNHNNSHQVLELFNGNTNANVLETNNQNFKSTNTTCQNNGILNEKKEKKEFGGPIKRGRRYLPDFKQEVLKYAKNHTFKETASHFNVNSNTITEWSREWERLPPKEKCAKTSPLSCSNNKNHKTDILGTPISKTEVILLNDICLETDYNESSSLTHIKKDLPSSAGMKPDERFLKWIEQKRLEKKELTRQEVVFVAKCCLKKIPENRETSWFVSWFKRYNKVLNSINSNEETEKYIKYPNSFKLEVVLYARLFTKNSAARVFNVPRKRMFDWFNHFNTLKESFGLIEKNESGEEKEEKRKIVFSTKKNDETKNKIYSELHLWYQKTLLNGTRPTSNDIKEKAREIFSVYGMKEIKFSDGWLQKFCRKRNIKLKHSEDDQLLLWVLTQFDNNVSLSHQEITEKSSSLIAKKKFKGSKGWTLRFLKRHRNLLQRSPTVSDQLPRIAQEKSTLFWENLRRNLTSFKIKPENIGCMDEIPLNFSYPTDNKGINEPLLRKTGFENCQGIVILSALASGQFLPPAVVFEGTGPKQLYSSQNLDILILYQEQGLVTADILETWMKDIWSSFVPPLNALVVDSFEPHRSKTLTQVSSRENCFLQVIPEGCSSKFQPLDVEITPSFKEAIKRQWKDFSAGSNFCSSRTIPKCRCPDRDTILYWIQNAYETVNRNPVSIINSFKTTGLLQ